MQRGIQGRSGRMQERERWVRFLFVALLGLMTVGCNEKIEDPIGNAAPPVNATKPSQVSSEPPSAGKSRKVGVSLPEKSAFYLAMQNAMETTAQANSMTLDFQYADLQTDRQMQQVDAFIKSGVDAILFCPADPKQSEAAVKRANTAQIPLFTVHLRAAHGDIEAHIGTDEGMGGQMAAQKIAALLKEKGNVLLEEVPNDPDKDQQERARGFQEEIARHPTLRLLHLWETGRRDLPINAIFFVNDEAASQTPASLTGGKSDPVVIVGYGGEARARAEIKKGQSYKADISPDPLRLGVTALDTIARSLRGEKAEAFVKVPPEVLDASSVDKP